MVVKRKVSLDGDAPGPARPAARTPGAPVAVSQLVLELFFNTGVVFHEVELQDDLPDLVSSFVVTHDPTRGTTVRRAAAGEEPTVELSVMDHFAELSGRWWPVPYQLSCPHAVQVYLAGADARRPQVILAVDTIEQSGQTSTASHAGQQALRLDANLDAGRPFRPLEKGELSAFLEHVETRDLVRKLEAAGMDKATFKLAALLETLAVALPRIRFSRVEDLAEVPVSLVLDFGNSRSTAVLVEAQQQGLLGVPLAMRSSLDPTKVTSDAFDSRMTFLPPPLDKSSSLAATGAGFALPSIARMGREALDRALETPHRYLATLSGPKRYLWDGSPTDERWHYACRVEGEYKPIFGRILKFIPDEGGGVVLRPDGPSTPADPRYAPRTMMLFALVEILSQAMAQINSPAYRAFQGKEGVPRVLRHVVLTYPSAMSAEERAVYEALVTNAVLLVCHVFNIEPARRPNWLPSGTAPHEGRFLPFLFVDEALAAQMVYVYQETTESFAGSMEDLVAVYGRGGSESRALRVASVDVGGGTSDVMIAEYADRLPGTGTALGVKKLFQDGINIAGDEVCRVILEDVVFVQLLQQLPTNEARTRLVHLFGEGDAGHGAAWRTLKAKLVPYFWMPVARCFWGLAEGVEVPEHAPDKLYSVPDLFRVFGLAPPSATVLAEADAFLGKAIRGFPGMNNFFFRLDRQEVERTVASVLREPLRKYADIIAQFDVDLVVLAGRTSALPCVKELFAAEMPVTLPRLKTMASYQVGDWYPSRWRHAGRILDPKSTVCAGATVLHLASRNLLPGFLLDGIEEVVGQRPIYGLYQETEPHLARQNELFRAGKVSPPFVYTTGMTIGFRNVDSEEMDASPLYRVRPRNRDVEEALLEDRVALRFQLDDLGALRIAEVASQKNLYSFSPEDFVLELKTLTGERYWLDSGVFKSLLRYAE